MRSRSEPTRRGRRGVTQKASNAVKNVSPGKEAAEDLIVKGMQPLAADLDCVATANDRNVVLNISTPKQFINRWIEEERITEAERGGKAHGRIRRHIRRNRGARSQLARVRKVTFVDYRGRDRREQVHVEIVDLRRAFDAVGRIAIGRNIEGLVRVLRVIEIVGD